MAKFLDMPGLLYFYRQLKSIFTGFDDLNEVRDDITEVSNELDDLRSDFTGMIRVQDETVVINTADNT